MGQGQLRAERETRPNFHFNHIARNEHLELVVRSSRHRKESATGGREAGEERDRRSRSHTWARGKGTDTVNELGRIQDSLRRMLDRGDSARPVYRGGSKIRTCRISRGPPGRWVLIFTSKFWDSKRVGSYV